MNPSPFMQKKHTAESGFVLITSLILLSLLTMMSLGMYFSSRSATKVSGAAQASTEAYYYAETAINYISWAFHNDAEIDSFQYNGSSALFTEALNADGNSELTFGDYMELMGWNGATQVGYPSDPGPTAISSSGAGLYGQVMYFDNTPMKDRKICFEDETIFTDCIDLTVAPGSRNEPVMNNISVDLPRYIVLEISDTGVVTPSIPPLPHPATPVVGVDVPTNGAIVWITGAVEDLRTGTVPGNADRDIEIARVDPNLNRAVSIDPATSCSTGNTMPNCPCDGTIIAGSWYACDAHANAAQPTGAYAEAGVGEWIASYNIVAYTIGYVNGKPKHLLRAVIR